MLIYGVIYNKIFIFIKNVFIKYICCVWVLIIMKPRASGLISQQYSPYYLSPLLLLHVDFYKEILLCIEPKSPITSE